MAHYFISYSTRDGTEYARRLHNELQAGPPPLTPWLSEPDMQVGDWTKQIDQAIKDCAALLLVMTGDSVGSDEVANEWSRALRYKKPIVPLRFESEVVPPYRLERYEEVDFGHDFPQAIARLRKLLQALDTPEARIEALERRREAAQRDIRWPQTEKQKARAELELKDVEDELKSLRGVRPLEIAKATDDVPEEEHHRVQTINRAPSPPLRNFQDRVQETELIGEFLDDPAARLLTVVGRAGVGKTAMVCRALHELERGRFPGEVARHTNIAGIVYLGAGPARDISFANLYEDLSRLLSESARATAERAWQESALTDVRVNTLATLLARHPVLVLLDNFEDLLDPASGEIVDREFAEVLRLLLVAPDHAIKLILTTREAAGELYPLEPGRQRYIELDSGLPVPFAQDLLRSMDQDGRVGLRDASADTLEAIWQRTQGLPRALEAFFAVLRADRFTSVDDLLGASSTPENVVEALVAEAFSRLDVHARAVMERLAVFSRPVPPAAVEFIAPIDSGPVAVEAVLRRLVTMYLVRHDRGLYYLHPVDRAYALSQLEPGMPGDWAERREGEPSTLATLRFLGAEYLRATRPTEISSLEDLEPAISEYELRSAAGDINGAVEVLFDHADAMLELGQRWPLLQLVDEVFDDANQVDQARLLAMAGFALSRLGRESQAVDRLRAAIDRSDETVAVNEVAAWRLELASCLHSLRDFDGAIDELGRVLEVEELGADAAAVALLKLAGIKLTQRRYAEAAHLQEAALEQAMLAALWETADDSTDSERPVQDRVAAIDLHDPTAWTVEGIAEVVLDDQDSAADELATMMGVACSIRGRDHNGEPERVVVVTQRLPDIWLARASLALAVDNLNAAAAACQLAVSLYEGLASFAAPGAISLLGQIHAGLGPRQGHTLDAHEAYLAEARERGLVSVEAEQLAILGAEYSAADRLQDAADAYQELEQLGRQERTLDQVVTARLGLARVAWIRDQTDAAIDFLEHLLTELPEERAEDAAEVLFLLGEIERSSYHYERAFEHLDRARSLFAEFGAWEPMIIADQRLAAIELEKRKYNAALQRLEAAVPIARSLGVPSVTASVLADLLTARLRCGDHAGARVVAEEAAQLAKDIHLPASAAELEAAAGAMWTELEDYDAAVASHERALKIYRTLERRVLEVDQLLLLAYVLGEAERFDEELTVASEAVKIANELPDPSQLRSAIVWLAIALADVGRHDEALAQIRPILADTDDPFVLGNAGWVCFVAGRYEESLELSRRAFSSDQDQEWLERNIAHALLALGRPDEAEVHYRHIIEGRRGGEHFARTIREVRRLLKRRPDLARGQELLALLERAEADVKLNEGHLQGAGLARE